MSTTDDPATILTAYRARRAAFEATRKETDARVEPLLRRYVAALFREHAGLNAVAIASYQDYDSSRIYPHAYVRTHALEDDAWGPAGFQGECPRNELDDEQAQVIHDVLLRHAPSLQRLHGERWCIAFWRDPSQKDGVATDKREHPGFD